MRIALVLACVLASTSIRADGRSPLLRRYDREKVAGMTLSFVGLAMSMTGLVFTIINHGFDRDTSTEQTRFGLSVGLAIAAAPVVTAGITLWARGAVHGHRERARLGLVANGLVGSF